MLVCHDQNPKLLLIVYQSISGGTKDTKELVLLTFLLSIAMAVESVANDVVINEVELNPPGPDK